MDELRWTSLVEQQRLIDGGEVGRAELNEEIRRRCDRLDERLHFLAAPLFDGPDDGFPILLKDAGQEVAGSPHAVGVAALRDAGHRSATTTWLAARFRQHGFSIIGKTLCPALASGITTEPPGWAPTRNPWDLTVSPGGSSGGSAAAVASGAVPVAHGSDATGSLRCPAAVCGLVTLNPTAGKIPAVPPAGQPPGDVWRDFVLARHAEDLQLVFDLLVDDPKTDRSPAPLTVGLLDHDPELGMTVHPACRTGVHITGQLLESLGHRVEHAWPTALDSLWASAFEAFGVVGDTTRPPMIDWVSDRLGRPVQRGELDDAVFDAAARAASRSHDEVAAAQAVIDRAIHPIEQWWDDHDLLVTPTTFQPNWKLGGSPGVAELGTLVAPFSLTGQPALSVPLHRDESGRPVGVQIVGRRNDDGLLLGLAQQLQRIADWTARTPDV